MSINPHAFAAIADLVRQDTSIVLEPGKEYLVEARLLPLARRLGTDVEGVIAKARIDAALRDEAVDSLTINETSWFRDQAPYAAMTEHIFPSLIAERAIQRRLRIWSAAASSGQEAYSTAILLKETLPPGWSAEIVATDVSPTMIERISAGRYGQVEMNRGMPATRLVQHFTRAGREWEVNAELRAMVTSSRLNLAEPWPVMAPFDLILMRNVLIYFDEKTKADILTRAQRALAPNGFLMLGSTESMPAELQCWDREAYGRVPLFRPAAQSRATLTGVAS